MEESNADYAVKLAFALLKNTKRKDLSVKEAVEIIELVSKKPEFVKSVLKKAEEEGLIKREKFTVYVTSRASSEERLKVKKAMCIANCRKCGKSITSCYYLVILGKELGPYGSTCVKMLI